MSTRLLRPLSAFAIAAALLGGRTSKASPTEASLVRPRAVLGVAAGYGFGTWFGRGLEAQGGVVFAAKRLEPAVTIDGGWTLWEPGGPYGRPLDALHVGVRGELGVRIGATRQTRIWPLLGVGARYVTNHGGGEDRAIEGWVPVVTGGGGLQRGRFELTLELRYPIGSIPFDTGDNHHPDPELHLTFALRLL